MLMLIIFVSRKIREYNWKHYLDQKISGSNLVHFLMQSRTAVLVTISKVLQWIFCSVSKMIRDRLYVYYGRETNFDASYKINHASIYSLRFI